MTVTTSTPIKNSNKFGKCSVNISFNDCNVLQQDSSKSLSNGTELDSANACIIRENFGISKFVSKTNNLSGNCSELDNESNEKTVLINKRFIPGFTPKAKKRKFPGPAGLLSEEVKESGKREFGISDTNHNNQMLSNSEKELENIASSQFSPEELLLPSWKTLQTEVSSCPNLLATAKYYSIRRVLHESCKLKLPKYIVAPILCVLIKHISYKDSSATLMLLDDTDEIKGSVDDEVVNTYKEHLQAGTALILKNVTFLFNVLILKKSNIVSIYLPNGKSNHIEDFGSVILESSEDRGYLRISNEMSSDHRPVHTDNLKTLIPSIIPKEQYGYNGKISSSISTSQQLKIQIAESKESFQVASNPRHTKAVTAKNTLKDASLNCDEMDDDFDQLFSTLDEKSFLEDI
ncbi:hypothetical protein X975_08181, partial [Stegodyphus mimosarum]